MKRNIPSGYEKRKKRIHENEQREQQSGRQGNFLTPHYFGANCSLPCLPDSLQTCVRGMGCFVAGPDLGIGKGGQCPPKFCACPPKRDAALAPIKPTKRDDKGKIPHVYIQQPKIFALFSPESLLIGRCKGRAWPLSDSLGFSSVTFSHQFDLTVIETVTLYSFTAAIWLYLFYLSLLYRSRCADFWLLKLKLTLVLVTMLRY